uniref:Uncharacterized protein n=1 Tax=Amphimedon queenslandica TaxID=400682 RepID=A0A1X7SHX0_AMPQE
MLRSVSRLVGVDHQWVRGLEVQRQRASGGHGWV